MHMPAIKSLLRLACMRYIILIYLMEAIPLCFNIEVYVFYIYNTTKVVKITNYILVHGDMFRLCLQPSSDQLVVQIRYKYCAYDMGSHKVYMCSTSEIKYSMKY